MSRETLVEAALQRFREGGESAVTFRQLAGSLGISHMYPYRYFRSKEELVAAMRGACFQQLFAIIKTADKPERSRVDRLYAITEGVFTHLFACPEEYRLMFALDQPPATEFPELFEIRQAIYGYLVEIVRDAVQAGELHGDPDEIMHLAWAMSHGLFTLQLGHQLVHGKTHEELVLPALKTVFAPMRDRSAADTTQRKRPDEDSRHPQP